MKNNLFSHFLLFLGLLFSLSARAQGPTLDPSFLPTELFMPGRATQVTQQPDGKRIIVGNFQFAGGVGTTVGITRTLAGSQQIDQVFAANIAGLQGFVDQAIILPNGQLLLVAYNFTPARLNFLTLGSVTRPTMLRLNTDGTPDPAFDLGTGFGGGVVQHVVAQPDGKLLVAGDFTQLNGQAVPTVVRLLPSGSPDPGFGTAGTLNGPAGRLALQPDGKVLVAGDFTAFAGQAVGRLVRLTATGGLDATFAAPVIPASAYVVGLTLQPDGKVVVAANRVAGQSTTSWPPLTRLTATGAPDPTFQTGTNFSRWFSFFIPSTEPVVVQPDGKLLVGTEADEYNGMPIGRVARLLPGGGLDPTFSTVASLSGEVLAPSSMQPLANGQLLLNTALLNADGTRDPGFRLPIQSPGQALALVRQTDGKLLVGGEFSEVNGVVARNLARLLPDGTVDAAFTAAAGTNGRVRSLALLPNGHILVGGDFSELAGASLLAIGQLLPGGQLDAAFSSPVVGSSSASSYVGQLVPDASGRVLLAGYFSLGAGSPAQSLTRLDAATGAQDPTYRPATPDGVQSLLLQPDGKVVAAGQAFVAGQQALVWRLLPNGVLDPAFTITPAPTTATAGRNALARDAAGRLYVGGQFAAFGAVGTTNVARLLPDGTPDASFVAPQSATVGSVNSLAVQPNGRVLLGGDFGTSNSPLNHGLVRLLAGGSADASFTPANGPLANVSRLLIQPDGAIVAAGSFQQVSGLPVYGLTRLLDANVLANKAAGATAGLRVWPVPAREWLSVALADEPIREVSLRDIGGRLVLRAAASGPLPVRLQTGHLEAGMYLLEVVGKTQRQVRRIVLE